MTKAENVRGGEGGNRQVGARGSALPVARLWSLACAVQEHGGCGGRLERDGLTVVCPCPCHGQSGVLFWAAPVGPVEPGGDGG